MIPLLLFPQRTLFTLQSYGCNAKGVFLLMPSTMQYDTISLYKRDTKVRIVI